MTTSTFLDHRLRPEAQPISWQVLSESQRDAFRRVIYLVNDYIRELDSQPPPSTLHGLEIDIARTNRLAFIDGKRGAGKSTVFLSLAEAVRNIGLEIPHPSDRFQEAIQKIRRRVVWLEPIDLDPLPSPFALIPTIVEKLHDQFEKRVREKGSSRLCRKRHQSRES